MLSGLKFNAPKCETNARLCLGRIRLLKNKKNMQMRQYRKDIADLLKAGKLDYAIIRVESVIPEQLTLIAYEILELYLELVAVRATMVAQSKTIPGVMMEALSSVLYASARCPELEELVKLRAMFEQKYGKEYVGCALSARECHRFSVNERLIRCLTVEPPPPDLKLRTLSAPAGGGGGARGGGGGTLAPLHPPVGPPQQGWLAKMENFQHIQPGDTPAAAAAAGSTFVTTSGTSGSTAAGGTGATGSTAAAGGFKVSSAEKIQRAYDQAQGAPPKPNLMGGGADGAAAAAAAAGGASSSRQVPMAPPPAAPPVKASEEDAAAAAAAAAAESGNSSGSGGALDLPSVPGGRSGSNGGGGAGVGGGGGSGAPDFDELQKRFEALEKS